MPIYEYKCEKCGTFDVMQDIKDKPLTTCPKCGGPVRKVIGKGVGIIFKGSGFYTTDHRSSEYKEKAKEDKSESKAADS